jgi:hypothetical protein
VVEPRIRSDSSFRGPRPVLSVDLGRGRVEELDAPCSGGRHDDVVAADVAQHAVDGPVHDELHADGRRHVQADVGAIHAFEDEVLVADRPFDELDQTRLEGLLDVLHAAGAEVVQDHDLVASCDEGIDQVGADETGTAGYEMSTVDLQASPRTSGKSLPTSPFGWHGRVLSRVVQVPQFRNSPAQGIRRSGSERRG